MRITTTPTEPEVDGVRLDIFKGGEVREVSAIIGWWLILQGYAEPEMRSGDQYGYTDISYGQASARVQRRSDY